MSTFGGKIQEIPEISVDRFDGENLFSEAFFLSHCHTDHMKGLEEVFFENLIKTNRYLYASEISCIILKKKYSVRSNLIPLCPFSPTNVFLCGKSISVISLPAGHCPGSLMFLFESDQRVLYTGDYRIHKNDIKKFKPFYNSLNEVKRIDKIYLDTTFFSKKYPQFPTRSQSLKELCKIIGNILKKGERALVHIKPSANYGYECCFKEIYEKLGMPVHVNEDAYEFYRFIPEMDNCVTLDGSVTRIHSNCGMRFKTMCDFGLDMNVPSISLTAFRWTGEGLKDGYISEYRGNNYFICYSTHASYEEGVALLTFLKPKEIEICVKHEDPNFNREMQDLLDTILYNIRKENIFKQEPKLFSIMDIEKKSKTEKKEWRDELEVLKSPPRVRRKIRWTRSEELKPNKVDQHFDGNIKISKSLNLHDKTENKNYNSDSEGTDDSENFLKILGLISPKKKEETENVRNKPGTSYSTTDKKQCMEEITTENMEGVCTFTEHKHSRRIDQDLFSDCKSIDEILGLATPKKTNAKEQSNWTEDMESCTLASEENLPSTSNDKQTDPENISEEMSPNSDNIILGIINNNFKVPLDSVADIIEVSDDDDDSQNEILMSMMDFTSNTR